MGKNNSVNGDVMFKFDASKYDIKDGNVTFWVWSPDIPSLGSVPIPASSTQGSAQSQTGNALKLGYSSATAESPRSVYTPWFGAVKIPYIFLEVTNSFAFSVSIRAKLFDPNDNPMPYKKMGMIVRLYDGTLDWIKDTIWGIIFDSEAPRLNTPFQNYTDSNGEWIMRITLNVPPYIKFGTLYVYASFEEDYWLWVNWLPQRIPAGVIYTSLTLQIGKFVSISTDINSILINYKKEFNYTKKEEKLNGLTITTYNYTAKIRNAIGINFTMKLGPHNYRTDVDEMSFNFINSISFRIFNKALEKDLNDWVDNDLYWGVITAINSISRVIFKQVWQQRYPPWDNLQYAKNLYTIYILSPKKEFALNILFANPATPLIYSPLISLVIEKTTGYSYYPSTLQIGLNKMLAAAYLLAACYSPVSFYSQAYSEGDYRYILTAIRGSILALAKSLIIGLKIIKEWTSIFLIINKWVTILLWRLLIELLSLLIPVSKILVKILEWVITSIVGEFVGEWIATQEYEYLKKNTYSPQFLLNLVDITQYDLSLLNYEINIWEQLRD
jgi:hypothetical protein